MVDRISKQRCFQIPVGPGALDESNLCKLLAQHGIRYWVNDMAVETVHGITRPAYTVPPPETRVGDPDGWYCSCGNRDPLTATRCSRCDGSFPTAQKASEQPPWPWQMCTGCGNEPNACTCDTQSEGRITMRVDPLPEDHPLRVAMNAAQAHVNEYLDSYELEADEGTYYPNEQERMLIQDAVAGLLSDEYLRLARAEINEREKLRQEDGECIECGRCLPEHWGGCSSQGKGEQRG